MSIALSIIQIIICIVIITLVLVQESPKGASGALTGAGDTDSHYDKIKGRTGDVIIKKITVFFAVLFLIVTFISNI